MKDDGPLHGVRVIDLSTIVFGPYASQFLGDYGADVIKVESLDGDSSRRTGPALEPGMACSFVSLNRNKRSIALDIKSREGREALLRLIESADVFINNIRPQKLAALGLDPQALRQRCPRLIYASLVGFSEAGPYSGRPAYDDIIQGMSGLADLMERQTGEMQYLPTVAADKISALVATQAILAALVGRARTGEGSHVEISMFEALAGFAMAEHLSGETFIPPLGTTGYSRVLAPSRRPYRTSDGYICVMPYTDEHWRRFFCEVGRPELASDVRFSGMHERTINIEALYSILAQSLLRKTTREWTEVFDRLDIPNAAVNRIEDLLEDEHLEAAEFFRTVDGGTMRLVGQGVRFDGKNCPANMPPRLGQHSRELLAEAGYSSDQIEAMIAAGTVVAKPFGAAA